MPICWRHCWRRILRIPAKPPIRRITGGSNRSSHSPRCERVGRKRGYPPYIGYWIARIKHARIRITLFHLLSFVAVAGCCVVGLDSRGVNEIVPVLGVPIALLPSLILAIAMLFRRQMAVARSHLYSFLLLLPLALLVEYGILQAIALSAMRGLRY